MKTQSTPQSNEKKTKIAYWLAWLAVIISTLGVLHDHFGNLKIPKKDDY